MPLFKTPKKKIKAPRIDPAVIDQWHERSVKLRADIQRDPDGPWAWLWTIRIEVIDFVLPPEASPETSPKVSPKAVEPHEGMAQVKSALGLPESPEPYATKRKLSPLKALLKSVHPPRTTEVTAPHIERIEGINAQRHHDDRNVRTTTRKTLKTERNKYLGFLAKHLTKYQLLAIATPSVSDVEVVSILFGAIPGYNCLSCDHSLVKATTTKCPNCNRAFTPTNPLTYRTVVPPMGHVNCRKCKYDLYGNSTGACPECGTMIAPPWA